MSKHKIGKILFGVFNFPIDLYSGIFAMNERMCSGYSVLFCRHLATLFPNTGEVTQITVQLRHLLRFSRAVGRKFRFRISNQCLVCPNDKLRLASRRLGLDVSRADYRKYIYLASNFISRFLIQ